MIVNTAFSIGFLLIIGSSVYNISIWIVSYFNKIATDEVRMFYGRAIYTKKINGTEISLGWIPLGGFVKLAGMVVDDEVFHDGIKPQPYDFNEKRKVQQVFVIFSGFLSLFFVGLPLLAHASPMSLPELCASYLAIAFFQTPLTTGDAIWEFLYTDFVFLSGFLMSLIAIYNLPLSITWTSIRSDALRILARLFSLLFAISIWVVLIRLAWVNFQFAHVFSCIGGGLLAGVLSILIYLPLARMIPDIRSQAQG